MPAPRTPARASTPRSSTSGRARATTRSAAPARARTSGTAPRRDARPPLTPAQAAALGTSRIIWHGWPRDARYSTLEGIREILTRGNGSDRQLRVYNANRDIVEVAREIADATEEGGEAAA